jgi:hypothetical protein
LFYLFIGSAFIGFYLTKWIGKILEIL